MLADGHAGVAVEGLEDHRSSGALRLGRARSQIRLSQMGDQKWPAQEAERLGETRDEAEGGGNSQQHRGLALGEDAVHQHGERNEAHAARVSTYQTATSGVPPAANLARTSAVGWRRMSGYSKSCCSRVKQTVKPSGTITSRRPRRGGRQLCSRRASFRTWADCEQYVIGSR